jgi:hypothetical protein
LCPIGSEDKEQLMTSRDQVTLEGALAAVDEHLRRTLRTAVTIERRECEPVHSSRGRDQVIDESDRGVGPAVASAKLTRPVSDHVGHRQRPTVSSHQIARFWQ